MRLDCTDAGIWALGDRWRTTNSQNKWAQVRELCRLQGVSKRFHHVAATVGNLHCRISPLKAEAEISGLATFLFRAKCAGALALTFGPASGQEEDQDEGRYALFKALAESQCLRELFEQAPCLERFAVVLERSTRSRELKLGQEMGVKMAVNAEAASNRLLEALAATCPRLSVLALGHSYRSPLRFPVLASSLGFGCKPFLGLRRLCIHEDVQFDLDGQGLTSLLSLCPNLLKLELERGLYYETQPPTNPIHLLIESDTLEFLKVEVRR